MQNFYEEIVETLEENNKTLNDIVWIGTREYKLNKEKFLEDSKHLTYDNGYGISLINGDLIIAGNNWYLERNEYDGSEWFDFVPFLEEPQKEREYTRKLITQNTKFGDCQWI